jgi:hypothetical protein
MLSLAPLELAFYSWLLSAVIERLPLEGLLAR